MTALFLHKIDRISFYSAKKCPNACIYAKFVVPLQPIRILRRKHMTCLQVLLALIFPPLAVVDRGCGSFTIVFILTLLGWVPGVIAALIILNKNENQ
jgi:uncharacterized membrane protein YqaE (UPF0057 family)